jgi:hypothetical protein
MLYDVPFFKHSNWFAKNVIGNWELAPVYTYQTGEWATVESNQDANRNGDAAGDRVILNTSATTKNTGSGVTALCKTGLPSFATCGENDFDSTVGPPGPGNFNSTPFVVGYLANDPSAQYLAAGLGALATVGRNTLLTKPINNVDMTAVKRINLTERYRVEFTAMRLTYSTIHSLYLDR